MDLQEILKYEIAHDVHNMKRYVKYSKYSALTKYNTSFYF